MFGMLKRHVSIQVVPNFKRMTYKIIVIRYILRHCWNDRCSFSAGFSSYRGLATVLYDNHLSLEPRFLSINK